MGLSYDEARVLVARNLERAAAAHEARRYGDLGPLFAEVDIPDTRGAGDEYDKIGIALNFLDGWVDASNHEWLYYEGFSRDDWPDLARDLVTSLRGNREIEVPKVLERFDLRASMHRPSIIERIYRRLFGR